MRAILLVVMFFVVGCSDRAYYDQQQFANRSECYQAPLSQRDECFKRANKSFDEYERERKELIGE